MAASPALTAGSVKGYALPLLVPSPAIKCRAFARPSAAKAVALTPCLMARPLAHTVSISEALETLSPDQLEAIAILLRDGGISDDEIEARASSVAGSVELARRAIEWLPEGFAFLALPQ